ncbi:hypothetical protein TNCV_4502901 [Trichonephila clavipes]|nr:hypothetical protein TNCV_4502901 [Trichonephila clavipes]
MRTRPCVLSAEFQFTEDPYRFQKKFPLGLESGKISRTQLQLSEEWKVWRTQLQLSEECGKQQEMSFARVALVSRPGWSIYFFYEQNFLRAGTAR